MSITVLWIAKVVSVIALASVLAFPGPTVSAGPASVLITATVSPILNATSEHGPDGDTVVITTNLDGIILRYETPQGQARVRVVRGVSSYEHLQGWSILEE